MDSRSRTSQTRATVDAGSLHATPRGTKRFADRFAARYADDFYRTAALDVTASSIGIGTYLGECDDADDAAYDTAIRQAVAAGVNVIDSAINYRCQRSEMAIGAAIQRLIAEGVATRDELIICTKGGYVPLDRTPPASRAAYQDYLRREFFDKEIVRPEDIVAGGHSIAPRFLRYCLAKSRQNLGARTIDRYYIHNPEQQLAAVTHDELRQRLTAAFSALEDAADRGEISAYGVATWDGLRNGQEDPGHLELETLVSIARGLAGDKHRFRTVQLPVNLVMNEAVRVPTQTVNGRPLPVLAAAAELGLDVVGSATLLQSKLTAGLPAELADLFPRLQTDAQRSIAFARGLDGLLTALVGMRRASHVTENLAAAER